MKSRTKNQIQVVQTTTILNTKISDIENKIPNHDKYVTTPEFNKLTAENYTAKLKQANLVIKTYIDKKLVSINKKITSNKTKYIESYKKLIDITKRFAQMSVKGYNFLLSTMCFTDNDGYQNLLVVDLVLSSLILDKLYSNKKIKNLK